MNDSKHLLNSSIIIARVLMHNALSHDPEVVAAVGASEHRAAVGFEMLVFLDGGGSPGGEDDCQSLDECFPVIVVFLCSEAVRCLCPLRN